MLQPWLQAAIQQDMPAEPLDYNTELTTVGWSNLAAGLCGAGFTGSYIFSQTIFSLRARVTSRVNGITVSLAELFLFLLPVSLVQYLPNFYFGSLLLLFGVEILSDWLLFSWAKVTKKEYLLLWATFIAVMFGGLQEGIGAGFVMATLSFAYSYARVNITAFSVVQSRSGCVRTFSERAILEAFSGNAIAVALSGYLFFGSAINVSQKVMEVADALLHPSADPRAAEAGGSWSSEALGEGKASSLAARRRAAIAAAPRFVLLDFRRVNGLDATAARTFGTLCAALQTRGVQLIITHVPKGQMRRLLAAHGVTAPPEEAPHTSSLTHTCLSFPTMDAGMQYCEEQFLGVAIAQGLCKPPALSMSLADILRSHLEDPQAGKSGLRGVAGVDFSRAAVALSALMVRRRLEPGELLFAAGDTADDFFLIEQGSVQAEMNLHITEQQRATDLPDDVAAPSHPRHFLYGPGSLVGDLDYLLERPRIFSVRCGTAARLLVVSRTAMARLSQDSPKALNVLQSIMLRAMSLSATHALEVMERRSLAVPTH